MAEQVAVSPCMVDGIRHEADCLILHTPALEPARRPCSCGGLLRELHRVVALYEGIWRKYNEYRDETERLQHERARLYMALESSKGVIDAALAHRAEETRAFLKVDPKLEEDAKAMFLATRNAMGWGHPEWEELATATKETYCHEVLRRRGEARGKGAITDD